MFWVVLRQYAPYVVWPFAAVVGFVGYNFEAIIGRKETPFKAEGIKEERDERKFEEMKTHDASDVPSLKSKHGIPKTILDRNDYSNITGKAS